MREAIPHYSLLIPIKPVVFSILLCLCGFFFPYSLGANPPRSFDELFHGLVQEWKQEVFSREGFIRTLEKNGELELVPSSGSGIDLYSRITQKKLSYLAEGLIVVPYSGRTLDRLDGYNALAKIRGLKGRVYHSHNRQAELPLFEDATRIESAEKNNPIPDPQPAKALPFSETIYVCIKDINFGNSYFRGELSTTTFGIIYNLTNFKTLTYFIFPVLKKEKFSATLYMEPLTEGMLVYVVAGADVSDFIASKISIPSALAKRGAVFVDWVSDNLKIMR